MKHLSAVVLSKNESENISKCLKSLQFCDEIIIVDDYSTDNTIELARKYTQKVFHRHLSQDFASQRNFGLSKSAREWVLFVDSDEVVSSALAREVRSAISYKPSSRAQAEGLEAKSYYGFYIKRQDYFMGKTLKFGETSNIKFLRLAKKSAGIWQRPVHEVWNIKGETATLTSPLLHYAHPTVSQFLKDIDHYTNIEANFRKNYSKIQAGIELVIFPIAKFVNNYIFKLGILDGLPGLIMALMMSYHSALVRLKILNLKS